MSADFGTEHYKGYLHPVPGSRSGQEPYIHVTQADSGSDYAIGDFSLPDLSELVQMAGQAWPHGAGVEVQFVIEARRPGRGEWQEVWSAPADEDSDGVAICEEDAKALLEAFSSAQVTRELDWQPGLEWRLSRRTVLAAVEVLSPDGAGE